MNNAIDPIDLLIKDYLVSRCYTNTVRVLEQDSSTSKDANFQVGRCVEEMTRAIDSLDVDKLLMLWNNWNTKIFNSLDQENAKLARQYETNSYRLLLVKCVQKEDIVKCNEFFKKMTSHTMNNPEWTEWFAFPYNPHAKDCEPFRKYFVKSWVEIFLMSFHNFLSTSIPTALPSSIEKIVEEIARDPEQGDTTNVEFDEELIDDFAVIAQCSTTVKRAHSKPTLRNIFKTLTGTKKSQD
ncbi:unnamed protein product [Caenorhabditis angaria]|uniref:ARMC9 CTLH-like domain-containing protein n=1 Tax=Caenorhabditis angaria TaxID=860376 RepID=A0A9P1J3Y7_9PELO|nr:unnamed protein product [Caenorhabditis angaria]